MARLTGTRNLDFNKYIEKYCDVLFCLSPAITFMTQEIKINDIWVRTKSKICKEHIKEIKGEKNGGN